MVRSAVATHWLVTALLLFGASAARGQAPEARGDVWEPAGPVSTSAGMTAVATDPDHPGVVWIGSATSVWVSEDDGQTFDLVLQLSREAGLVRETVTDEALDEATELEGDPEAEDALEEELLEEGIDVDDVLEVETGVTTDTDVGTSDDAVDVEIDSDRFGVVRMRLHGDLLYVCTSRGLYTVDRAARRVGASREVRFGHKVAVNDVAVTPDARIWIAVGSSRVDLQACKLEYSIVSPK